MKILLTGAHGMLAREIIGSCDSAHQLELRDLEHLDITCAQAVEQEVRALNPDLVINCAAFTDVDGCESRQEHAFAVNGQAPGNLARACRQTGARLCHISTDFVFDGSKGIPYLESDPVNPLSVYGASKAAGEAAIRAELGENALIIRTSWMFGAGGPNFVSTILRLAAQQDEIRVVYDQVGCPTYAVDCAQALWQLVDNQASGIVHVCNSGVCSWYEFARETVRLAGLMCRVTPVTSDEFPRPARRPSYSVMYTGKYSCLAGAQLQPWKQALTAFLDEIGAAA